MARINATKFEESKPERGIHVEELENTKEASTVAYIHVSVSILVRGLAGTTAGLPRQCKESRDVERAVTD